MTKTKELEKSLFNNSLNQAIKQKYLYKALERHTLKRKLA